MEQAGAHAEEDIEMVCVCLCDHIQMAIYN